MARYHSPPSVQCLKMLAQYFYLMCCLRSSQFFLSQTAFLSMDTARQCPKGRHLVTGGNFKSPLKKTIYIYSFFRLQSYYMELMSFVTFVPCHLCSKVAQFVPGAPAEHSSLQFWYVLPSPGHR